jgi:hypothetical protein
VRFEQFDTLAERVDELSEDVDLALRALVGHGCEGAMSVGSGPG